MSICFEIHSDIVMLRFMVEMFHTSRHHCDRDLKRLPGVPRRTAIGICCLNETDLDGVRKFRLVDKIDNKGSQESGNLVAVQQTECTS